MIVGLIAPGEQRASGRGKPFFTRTEQGPPMNPFSFARRFEAWGSMARIGQVLQVTLEGEAGGAAEAREFSPRAARPNTRSDAH